MFKDLLWYEISLRCKSVTCHMSIPLIASFFFIFFIGSNNYNNYIETYTTKKGSLRSTYLCITIYILLDVLHRHNTRNKGNFRLPRVNRNWGMQRTQNAKLYRGALQGRLPSLSQLSMCCVMSYPLFYVVHYVFQLFVVLVCFMFLLAFTKSILISPVLHLIRPKDSTQSLTPTHSKTLFSIRHNNDFTPGSEH